MRWAGGKRQLLPALHAALPADFDLTRHRFYEPFAGGLAFTFSLHERPMPRRGRAPIVVNDTNPELIAAYRSVRDHTEDLIGALTELAKDTSADRYYEVRDWEPDTELERGARMIYLNRLSFNGIHRVNKSGKFNVPYGKLANPTVCDTELLRACATMLAHVEIRYGSYVTALADAREGDVVYLDPPYIPLTPTASFTSYAVDGFGELDQYALAGTIRGLIARGARVILSNSDTPATRAIFGADLDLRTISVARSVGASAASRARVDEVIGTSYPTADHTSHQIDTAA